jgi:hypothetical protein
MFPVGHAFILCSEWKMRDLQLFCHSSLFLKEGNKCDNSQNSLWNLFIEPLGFLSCVIL